MGRSWASTFYDLALLAGLLLPLGIITAVSNERIHAAIVYSTLLGAFLGTTVLVSRRSRLSLSAYWRSLKKLDS